MFRHILVPLDGSARAEQALPVVARLARTSGSTITLLQIVDLAHDAFAYGIGGVYITEDTIEDYLASARSYLDRMQKNPLLAGITVKTQTVLGNPAAVITELAANPPIDLIVISSHGYTRVKRWIMGSVAEKVARHACVPVLILRDGEPLHTHRNLSGATYVRALVPLDTSPRSQDALVPAAELVAALSTKGAGELCLTQMVVSTGGRRSTEREELVEAAEQNLATIAQSIRDGLVAHFGPELNLTISSSVSVVGDVAEGILLMAENSEERAAFATAARCDLVAMTTHGASGIRTWPVGSITERVLHATRLPMLIVRPADMLAQEHQQQATRTKAAV